MYAPDENGLGGLQVVDDVQECRRFKTAAEFDVCMIGKGYQRTAKGYSRSTGISPKVILGVAAAIALPMILPAILPGAVAAAGAGAAKLIPKIVPIAEEAVKSIAAKGTPEAVPGPAAVPVVVSPGPSVSPAVAQAQLEPWVIPAGIGALVLLLALNR